jgi:hypothetical protein
LISDNNGLPNLSKPLIFNAFLFIHLNRVINRHPVGQRHQRWADADGSRQGCVIAHRQLTIIELRQSEATVREWATGQQWRVRYATALLETAAHTPVLPQLLRKVIAV